MGNKLSCSCAPLIKKGYRYEDSPWQANARGRSSAGGERRGETGHLLRCGSLRERKRLWAEVFHVTSGAGSVKWQQVSEDLVPVNITCIQDTPETIFHITAYNCQVDKILDVRLVQPGTRIGQASECFVYWKDTMTNDTWGLNFTCPIDAKQFRECVSPSFKIPRKASSSYSLRLEPLNSKQSSTKQKVRRKPLSTPASPSRGASREPQCTCMTPEQFNRLRQDPRYRPTCVAAQTLPRLTSRSADAEMQQRGDKMPNAVSSGSLYDNVNNSNSTGVGPGGQMSANSAAAQGKLLKPGEQQQQQQQHTLRRQTSVDKQQQSEQMCQTGVKTANVGIGTTNVGSQVRRAWFMQDQVEGPDQENKPASLTPGGGGPHPKKPLLKHQDSMTRQTSFDMGTQSSVGGGLMPGGRYQHRKEQLQHTRSADYTEMELRNGNLFASLDNNNVPPGGRRNKSKSTDDMRIENAHLQGRPPSGLAPQGAGPPGGPMGQQQQQQHPLLAAAGPGGSLGGVGVGLGVGAGAGGVGPLPAGGGMLGAAGHMLPPGMVVPPPPPPHVVDHHTLKRMFKPMSSIESPVTSPEMTRKRHPHHINFHQCYPSNNNQQHRYVMSDAENDNYAVYRQPYHNRLQTLRRVHEMNRHYSARTPGAGGGASKLPAGSSASLPRPVARHQQQQNHVGNGLPLHQQQHHQQQQLQQQQRGRIPNNNLSSGGGQYLELNSSNQHLATNGTTATLPPPGAANSRYYAGSASPSSLHVVANNSVSYSVAGGPSPRAASPLYIDIQAQTSASSTLSMSQNRAVPINRCVAGTAGDVSPPSDNVLFDNQCYATTPSSSNGNSDPEQQQPTGGLQQGPPHCQQRNCNGQTPVYGPPPPQRPPSVQAQQRPSSVQAQRPASVQAQRPPSVQRQNSRDQQPQQGQGQQNASTPGSPTSRLLLEYEMHLRNTLAKGMDAETYSMQTFETIMSQSMDDCEYGDNANGQPGQQSSQRTPTPRRRSSANKSSTLPQSYRYCTERQNSRDRDGYYSDRNEIMRERRERDYDRDRGYQSDYNSSRCASCIGESARAQWFRHSDGWRSGSSTFGSTASSVPTYTGFHRGGPWDSLPSLRHEGSLNDSGYKSNRTDSLEHRGTFDRQDSVRSDYMSDRESRYGIVQQASLESTDSRLCYLTSSEMSDDDRMSLTTAVSDDDDGESAVNSPYRGKQTGQAAASFNCTGAVRKAGFLSVKKWLLRKKHQIELARKRGWKGYWVCLKGTTLLFYPCESQENRAVETAPKHLIIVDGAIMQPIPEHPKRDYIFCLSTAFGDAYLFQAPCQVELENWVNSIHSACAAAFARHRGKTGTLHLLQEEIFRLDKAIETDHKLRHMADLQQSVVTDIDTKSQINNQIMQYEENLERLHCEQFRLRCYMASLQSGELPNPKSLLTHVSRATKQMLNKLGVFTVSSFHAYICARSPSLLNNLLAGRGATKRRPLLLSRSNSGSSRRSLQISRDDDKNVVKVTVPENQLVSVFLRDGMTVEEFLASACSRKGLNAMEHFVRVKKRRDMEDHNYFVPHRSDVIETYLHTHEIVEVCAKILYQVELQRNTLDQMWGFSVEAELIENADRQDELCCYVSRVEDKSVAMQNGIIKGDEIMVINGAIVSDLDMMYLESVLQEEQALCMMMRSSRTEPPDVTGIMRVTDDIIESLVCPPPPQDPPVISEEMISGLIVPAPGWTKEQVPDSLSAHDGSKPTSRANSFEIENLLKTAEQVTGICRSPGKASPTGSVLSAHSQALTPSRQLTDAEKLKKVILELVETERTYVKNLNSLLENYLEPLKRETFLSNAEINALFGNIQEIVAFQRQFLQNLDHAIEVEPEFLNFEHPSQFKGVLFSIGSAFLFYVNHFKLYSSFCASHSKAQKVLHPNEGNQALQEFLQARNPRQQHSSTLESYLIKPIQRILKYPLLLQQLRNLTDEHSDERRHLIGALNGMEKVAEHINEMQRIHEEYGAIFDHLFRQHQKSCKQSIDLSPGDLLYYGGVEWLNISDFLGKIKKGLELHAMCFVFKSAVVFLCKEKLRQKKKLMFDLQGGSKANTGKKNDGDVEIIRYQVLIPVTEVQVRSSSAKDMESHFLWELIHLRSQLQRRSEKVYVLSNSTSDFRNSFLKTIRQIIRESVRNMSIPSTRSQQLAQQTMTMGRHHGGGNDKSSAAATNGHHPSVPPSLPTGSSGTGTLSKKAMKQQMLSNTLGARRKYTHTRQPIDRDSSEDAEELHHHQQQMRQHHGQQTFRTRSKTISDSSGETKVEMESGAKSEGEEDSQAYGAGEKKTNLGRTPNHLTLSTTSTISAGSTGSQAKLIQSSHHPEHYQPAQIKELGSPVWKPRELGESMTLPRKGKASAAEFAEATSSLQHGGASRKSLFEINNHV